ncbi:MAG: hypothetical protein ACR2O3_01990 [Rhizobiaceae bacterium]
MKKMLTISAFVLSTSLVFAQGPLGVAFVEAPEQSSGMCFADNADYGFACARQKCMANGTLKADCLRVRWCYPAGWSADMFLQHKEGLHWHQYLCGWSSREDIETAANLICEGSQKKWLIECTMVRLWNPNGTEIRTTTD